MPIRPDQRWFYPIDWKELSYEIRMKRAKALCEICGRPHMKFIIHLSDGRWWDAERGQWRDGAGRRLRKRPEHALYLARMTYVVLACAHLDHDPANSDPRNLAALCQRCHMLHDAAEHRYQRWWNAFRNRALGDLFLGRY